MVSATLAFVPFIPTQCPSLDHRTNQLGGKPCILVLNGERKPRNSVVEIMFKELKGEKKIYLLKTPKKVATLVKDQNLILDRILLAIMLVDTLKEFNVNFFPAI